MDIFSIDNVIAGFFGSKPEFCRDTIEGFSKGNYYSFNCSKFVSDDLNAVNQNLNIVKETFGVDKLITLNQIHSNKCIIVDESTTSDLEADAMVTCSENIALGILTADCVPLLFCDSINKIIGAAHGGWKGVKAGVVENTVDQMCKLGSKTSNISAIIGPCIHVDSYEVDLDFLNNFPTAYFETINNKPHFDIVKFCIDILKRLNVNNITISETDTYKAHDQFFSYRYARKNTDGICGRNISVICNNPNFWNLYKQNQLAFRKTHSKI